MFNKVEVGSFDNKPVVISKEYESLFLRLNNAFNLNQEINIYFSYEMDNVFYINALQMIRKQLELLTYDKMLETKDDDDLYNAIHETYINNLLDVAKVLNNDDLLKGIDVLLEVKVIYYDFISMD